jgi:predicted TIM-barrel fold metal-dependent hydrolase
MPLFDIHAYFGPAPIVGGLTDLDSIIAVKERFGIDAIGLISLRARYSDFVEGNAQVRTVADANSGIFAYVTGSTSYPDETIQEMRIYLGKHAFLGTVLFPNNGVPVKLAEARDIINAGRRYTKPILIYVDSREGVIEAANIAEEFEQLRFILLNMGGEDWRFAVNAARRHINIFLEISGTFDAEKITHAAASISPRKLLFGSGIPFTDPNLYEGMLKEAPTLSASERKRVEFDNALSAFNIEAEVE